MPDFIPIDEFVSDEWYPGFPQTNAHAPWVAEGLSTFQPGDEQRFWLLDFHYPRGMVPLGYIFPEDGICWGTQLAAGAAAAAEPRPGGAWPDPHLQRTGRRRLLLAAAVACAAHRRQPSPFLAGFPTIWADRASSWRAGWPTSRPTTTPSTRRRRSAPTSPTPRRSSSGRGRSTSR